MSPQPMQATEGEEVVLRLRAGPVLTEVNASPPPRLTPKPDNIPKQTTFLNPTQALPDNRGAQA